MSSGLNPESLTSTLCNPKSIAIAVVVYSNSYSPSLQFLASIKTTLQDFPLIQLIAINADDHRHLLGLPILGISEVPSLVLFSKGRPVSQPIVDQFQAICRLRRVALQTMETDDFEPVGTTIKVPPSANLTKWRPKSSETESARSVMMVDLLSPLWVAMDSVYEI